MVKLCYLRRNSTPAQCQENQTQTRLFLSPMTLNKGFCKRPLQVCCKAGLGYYHRTANSRQCERLSWSNTTHLHAEKHKALEVVCICYGKCHAKGLSRDINLSKCLQRHPVCYRNLALWCQAFLLTEKKNTLLFP